MYRLSLALNYLVGSDCFPGYQSSMGLFQLEFRDQGVKVDWSTLTLNINLSPKHSRLNEKKQNHLPTNSLIITSSVLRSFEFIATTKLFTPIKNWNFTNWTVKQTGR